MTTGTVGCIGILGSGQLGRMIAIAAAQLGLDTHIYAPDAAASPAAAVAGRLTEAAYDDLAAAEVLKVTLPWMNQDLEDTRALMGENFWPYGVKANRKELDLVMRYTHEQGLAKRRLKVDEVFHPSTLELIET